MRPIRRLRWRAQYAHAPEKVAALRQALIAAGCTGVERAASVTLTFEEGAVVAYLKDGEVTVIAELEGVSTAAVKAAIERELGLVNPACVEDDGAL